MFRYILLIIFITCSSVSAHYAGTVPWVVIGDSTVAEYGGNNAVATYVDYNSVTLSNVTDLSDPGDTIAQQDALWDALASGTKTSSVFVIVQIGLNDLNPAESAATALGRYQTLIDAIASDAPQALIFTSTMTPCKARLITLYGETDGATSYQKWLDMNEAIIGQGANAITGMDGYINSHTTSLNDGSGNLDAAYDSGDGIHPNNTGRDIIGAAWATKLAADGLFNYDVNLSGGSKSVSISGTKSLVIN